MKAIVLVGGFGTRLRPLTSTTPKQMLPVVDRPMIQLVLECLGAQGVTDAVLSLGYRPDVFIEAYPDDVCAGVRLHYAVEPEPLDTAGAVAFAARESGIDSTFLVINGDVLTDLDLAALWKFHVARGGEATIALTAVEDPSRYGVVVTDDDGRVLTFVEKPPRDDAPSQWINAGTYVLEPSVVARIPDGVPTSIERVTFPALVEEGRLWAMTSEAYWIDAGTPATYLRAQLDLIDGTRGPGRPWAAPTAVIDPSATVSHSVVMHGVSVASGAHVADSVLLPGAQVHVDARVEGSIVGPGSVVGAGASVTGGTVLGEAVEVAPSEELSATRVPGGAA